MMVDFLLAFPPAPISEDVERRRFGELQTSDQDFELRNYLSKSRYQPPKLRGASHINHAR